MNLLLISSVVLAFSIVMLYIYQQKSLFIKMYNDFCPVEDMVPVNNMVSINSSEQSFSFQNNDLQILETKRLNHLNKEKSELNKQLKALEFITNFEMYLSENKVDMDKFNQFIDFKDLKFSTQRSILESTKKVSNLSAA